MEVNEKERNKEISEWIHGYFRFFSCTTAQKSLATPSYFSFCWKKGKQLKCFTETCEN